MQSKKRSTLKIVLITLGVIILLIIIAIGSVIFLANKAINSFNTNDKSTVMAVADQFIADINQDKLTQAAGLADSQYVSIDNLTADLNQLQIIYKGYEREDTNFLSEKIDQFTSGKVVTYSTTAYFSDNTQGTLNVTEAQKNGVWKIQGIKLLASLSHMNGDIVENGDQVSSTLQNTIITAYESEKSIYTSGNLSAIRREIILSDPSNAQQIAGMSDLELMNASAEEIKGINLVGASTSVFRSHDAIWTFNKDMTSVLIQLPIIATSTNGQVGHLAEQGAYSNGQWYF